MDSMPYIYEEATLIVQDDDWYNSKFAKSFNKMLYQDIGIMRTWFSKKAFKRLVIYPRDIEIIFGKSPRAAREYLSLIRDALGKSRGAPVTFYDFCKYSEIDEETVIDFMHESW